MNPVKIAILARAPVPGAAKTRLIPALGVENTARLAARMLNHGVQQAQLAQVGPVELWVTEPGHPVWSSLAIPSEVDIFEQGYGDLGDRMAQIAKRAIGNRRTVILMGTDCPALDARRLRSLAEALQSHDAAIVPARDGGYVALALNRYEPGLFQDMPWSTREVLAVTLQKMDTLGWRYKSFPALRDIDEPQDLVDLPVGWLQIGEASASQEPPDGAAYRATSVM